MFGKLSHADALKRPMLKWLLLFLAVILIVAVLVSVIRYKQGGNEKVQNQGLVNEVQQAKIAPTPLANADELRLQRQLQDIVAKGKKTDCMTLSDERYQSACDDFFTIQK